MQRCIPILAAGIVSLLALPALAADASGRWRTIDDETGQPKSIVEITRADNGTYTGTIIELFNPSRPNPTCDKCPADDDRKDQPVVGMEIIRNMRASGANYSGGTVLKPDEGKIYKSKMKLVNDDTLEVSGCILFFCRSQTWQRV